MSYEIHLTPKSAKQLSKMDKPVQKKIAALLDKLAEDPQSQGKQLTCNLSELWSWRTGDYRVLGEIQEDKLIVLVVKVGHRKNVYK